MGVWPPGVGDVLGLLLLLLLLFCALPPVILAPLGAVTHQVPPFPCPFMSPAALSSAYVYWG